MATSNSLAGYTQQSEYNPLKYESLSKKIQDIDLAVSKKKQNTLQTLSFNTPLIPTDLNLQDVFTNPPVTSEPLDINAPRRQPLPANYPTIAPEQQPGVVAPTKESFLSALPQYVGGGQMNVDPSQTDQILKSNRGYDSNDNLLLRAGLSSRLFQIDHIVPLWAGGSDTNANKELLNIQDHTQKTLVDAVGRQLYYNKELGLTGARAIAINWKGKDVSGIQLDENGEIPLEVARQKYAQWQQTPKVTFMDWLKETPSSAKKLLKTAETMLPTPAQSALEGAITGFSGGWIPTEAGNESFAFADPDFEPGVVTEAADKVARFVGQAGGTILSFIALQGLVSRLGAITGLTKLWQNSRIATVPLIRVAGSGAAANYIYRNITLAKTLETMGLFALRGQLSRQEVDDFAHRTTRLLKDMRDGAFFGLVSPIPNKWTGAGILGAGVYTLNRLDGATNEEALLNATTIAGLHLAFRWNTTEAQREQHYQDLATKKAIEFRSKYLGRAPGDYISMQFAERPIDSITGKPVMLSQQTPKGFITLGQYPGGKVELRSYNANTIKTEDKIIVQNITNQWRSGAIDNATDTRLRTETKLSGRQLYKQSLARDASWIEDVKDFFSLGAKIKKIPVPADLSKPTNIRINANGVMTPEIIPDTIDTSLPENLRFYINKNPDAGKGASTSTLNVPPEILQRKNLTGEMSVTGVAKKGYLIENYLVPEANKNLIEAAKIWKKDASRIAPNIIIVRDQSVQMRDRITVANEKLKQAVAEGKVEEKYAHYYNPNEVLSLYVKVDDKLVQVGHAPLEKRIGTPVTDEMGSVVGYEGLPDNKNQSIMNLSKRTGRYYNPLDPGLGAEYISADMEKIGVSILEAPIKKMEPRGVFSNEPYLVYQYQNESWVNSYAKNQGIPKTDIAADNTNSMQAVQSTLSTNSSDYVTDLALKDTVASENLVGILKNIEQGLQTNNAPALRQTVNQMLGDNFFKDDIEAQQWIDNKYEIKVIDVFKAWDTAQQSGTAHPEGQVAYDYLKKYLSGGDLNVKQKQQLILTPLLSRNPQADVINAGRQWQAQKVADKVKQIREIQKAIIKRYSTQMQNRARLNKITQVLKKAKAKITPKVKVTKKVKDINKTIKKAKSKELKPLVIEAKKYGSAEEFVNAFIKKTSEVGKLAFQDTSEKIPIEIQKLHDDFIEYAQNSEIQKIYQQGGNDVNILTDIWNKANKVNFITRSKIKEPLSDQLKIKEAIKKAKEKVQKLETSSIQKAKAAGRSFDEWVKGQEGVCNFDEIISFKNDFETKLGLDRALEAYGAVVYPQNIYKASEQFTARQLRGLSDWYGTRLETKNNPGMAMVKTLLDIDIIPKKIKTRSQLKAAWDKLPISDITKKPSGVNPQSGFSSSKIQNSIKQAKEKISSSNKAKKEQ